MHNPLVPDILSHLHTHPDGLSEFELMQALGKHAGFASLCDSGQLALFQKHFMVMNGLYQLQQQLWQDEELVLEISPLLIQLNTPQVSAHDNSEKLLTESSTLASYYLDWENFEGTSEKDVIDLLSDFWCRFVSNDDRDAAYEVLGLEQDADLHEVKQCYRRLAAQHHPDKGGDRDKFIEVRQAYEILVTIQ